MPKYPILKPQEIIRILKLLGFAEIRQKGSHKQFKHFDGRFTTLPFHKGENISPILLRQILTDIKIDLDEFKKLM
jgi:predicted RNA binding protein YcfA (HicA-like mRNA interferase family)